LIKELKKYDKNMPLKTEFHFTEYSYAHDFIKKSNVCFRADHEPYLRLMFSPKSGYPDYDIYD